MKKIIFLIFLLLPFAELQATTKNIKAEIISEGNLTLREILVSSPEIAEFTPSKFVAKIDDNIIVINGSKYEIRLFFFEDLNNNISMNYYDFCRKYNLLDSRSQIMDQGYGPIEFFSSTFNNEFKRKGIHFLFSLRKIE